MKLEILVLFPVSIACDIAGQVFFKLGADRLGRRDDTKGSGPPEARGGAVRLDPWLLAGIATFAVEAVIWMRILALTPLSIAFPIASLNFIGVTVASRYFFKEQVSPAQWLGCILVTAGVSVLAIGTEA